MTRGGFLKVAAGGLVAAAVAAEAAPEAGAIYYRGMQFRWHGWYKFGRDRQGGYWRAEAGDQAVTMSVSGGSIAFDGDNQQVVYLPDDRFNIPLTATPERKCVVQVCALLALIQLLQERGVIPTSENIDLSRELNALLVTAEREGIMTEQ